MSPADAIILGLLAIAALAALWIDHSRSRRFIALALVILYGLALFGVLGWSEQGPVL